MPSENRVSKAAAEYRDRPMSDVACCGTCTMYLPPNQCTLVEGPVHVYGWCRFYEKALSLSRIRQNLTKGS